MRAAGTKKQPDKLFGFTFRKSITIKVSVILFFMIFCGNKKNIREIVTIYYDPKWSNNISKYRNVFSQNTTHKLYKNGDFFDIQSDILEENSLNIELLSEKEKLILEKLSKKLSKFPSLPHRNEFE